MRREIVFYLNGRPQRLEVEPHQTVLELIRGALGLSGTKEGCGEGDCGACTVLVGFPEENRVHYRAITSCLMLACQLDGKHLVTVEGLEQNRELHPIQQAVIDSHATQCGFCTPGVVMSLLGLYLENPGPNHAEMLGALEGNLCRCTGYVAIKSAGESLQLPQITGQMRPAYFDAVDQSLLLQKPVLLSVAKGDKGYHRPTTREELVSVLEGLQDCRFMSGGTDLVVAMKKHGLSIGHLVDLSGIEEFKSIQVSEHEVSIGASAKLSDIQALKKELPPLAEAIGKMASHQVRTLGTLAGNLGNASPVADSAPILLAYDARLVLGSARGTREIPLSEYYQGYKKTALGDREWIERIVIPRKVSFVNFEKASKRRNVDISTTNGAIGLTLDGRAIRQARVAFGGVGPVPLLAPQTSEYLQGKEYSLEVARAAAQVALKEVTPIDDVRGSAEYRRALVEGLMLKHYLACAQAMGWN